MNLTVTETMDYVYEVERIVGEKVQSQPISYD